MTTSTNAALIATAKAMHEQMDEEPKPGSILALWFETAARLEAAEQERDEARKAAEDHVLDADAVHVRLSAELREVNRERDNWKMSAEEAERAEKRWKDRAVEAERERDRLDEAFDRDLPWRYDEVEAQRNQLAAVVEKVRVARGNHPACEEHPDGDVISCGWKSAVLDIDVALTTAPADALREMQAAAWEEGFDACEEDRLHHDAHGWGDEDCIDKTWNPYADSPRHNAPQRREEQA